jgi:hypothetical protein
LSSGFNKKAGPIKSEFSRTSTGRKIPPVTYAFRRTGT